MLYFSSELKTYHVEATDGELGKILDVYFDDKKWAVRYAVLDTRKWLPGRRVILSPTAFVHLNKEERKLEVVHDKETVRNSPEISEESFISSDIEHSLSGYYGWSRYWMGNMLWGEQEQPILPTLETAATHGLEIETQVTVPQDYGLRSEEETLGFKVHASDGGLGKVADLIFDDEYWKVQYIIVQDNDVLEGSFYAIRPEDLQSVAWFEEDMYVKGSLADFEIQKRYKTKDEIMVSL